MREKRFEKVVEFDGFTDVNLGFIMGFFLCFVTIFFLSFPLDVSTALFFSTSVIIIIMVKAYCDSRNVYWRKVK